MFPSVWFGCSSIALGVLTVNLRCSRASSVSVQNHCVAWCGYSWPAVFHRGSVDVPLQFGEAGTL
nr:MAG TPA: hypothetical protein [Caudoviricetes sp.]